MSVALARIPDRGNCAQGERFESSIGNRVDDGQLPGDQPRTSERIYHEVLPVTDGGTSTSIDIQAMRRVEATAA